MLARQVNDAEFPIEQDIALPMLRKGWRQVGAKWVRYDRPYPGRRSGTPLRSRMLTLDSCMICHVAPVLRHDRYGGRGQLIERLCKDCYGTYERSGHSSEYQNRINDAPILYANMANYRESTRNEPTGEQRLAAAIIASAAADVWRETRYHGKSKDRAETREWLRGADAPITFNWCCEALDVDPEWMRRMVLTASEKYATGWESKRPAKGFHHPAVGEDVPDVDGSERSNPMVKSVSPTPESAIAAAIMAIATYTG